MRFISFEHGGQQKFGALMGEAVVDLSARHPELADLREAIRQEQLGVLSEEAQQCEPDFDLADIDLKHQLFIAFVL